MRFADYGWGNCEPTYDQVLSAAYLEAKGYEFGRHFDVKNVEELAESVYQMQIMMEREAQS